MNNLQFNIYVSKRVILFICASLLCIILGSVIVQVVMHGGMTTPRIRIATVFQDITFFIMPAIITAIICCRQPADFLMIKNVPKFGLILLTIGIIVASVPMMNAIIEWNMSLQLPENMHGIEEWMKNSEKNAMKFTEILIGGSGIKSYIAALLIVGVLAGFSEELFFRGTIQRLFTTSGVNLHLAVWTTAFIFSAIHLQFYGFIPRLMLGVFFGYAVAWSGNLWLGIIAHFTNNAIAATGMTIGKGADIASQMQQTIETTGLVMHKTGTLAIVFSVLLTGILIYIFKRVSQTSCD
ncbi:MAG: CPBP family intramembrane metalloprotease [Paramuribaculum sp.]|nr:CPBP family intramembrane metalloprotease [Paramuribaculum sp.]